jgi:hypothetical protein
MKCQNSVAKQFTSINTARTAFPARARARLPSGWVPQGRSGFGLELQQEGLRLHFILNAYSEPLDFELPPEPQPWCRWIDTALDCPHDIVPWETAPRFPGQPTGPGRTPWSHCWQGGPYDR